MNTYNEALAIQAKVIIENSRGWRFLWNRNWRFGPVGITEKNEQLLRPFFSCFHGQKKDFFFKNIVAHTLKDLNFFFEFFKGQETFSIVSCSTRDTSPRDFSIMA